MGFLQISHTTAYQQRGASDSSDFNPTKLDCYLYTVLVKQSCVSSLQKKKKILKWELPET